MISAQQDQLEHERPFSTHYEIAELLLAVPIKTNPLSISPESEFATSSSKKQALISEFLVEAEILSICKAVKCLPLHT